MLPGILGLLTNIFSDKLARGLETSLYNISSAFGLTQKQALKVKESFVEQYT
jgi:hypothetical protein